MKRYTIAIIIFLYSYSVYPNAYAQSDYNCRSIMSGKIIYLQKTLETSQIVAFLLQQGARVVTETAATAQMRRLKVNSYQNCRNDRCQIELGQAVSASLMASRTPDQLAIYLWDLKQEAIVCIIAISNHNQSNQTNDPPVRQITQDTLLIPGMDVKTVLEITGMPNNRVNCHDDSFVLFFHMPHNICHGEILTICALYFNKDNILTECKYTKSGICPLYITQN
jgi:hypothetical protein